MSSNKRPLAELTAGDVDRALSPTDEHESDVVASAAKRSATTATQRPSEVAMASSGVATTSDVIDEAQGLHPCSHEVCLPASLVAPPAGDAIYDPPMPATLVREYPFVLDNFQRKSIGCLTRKESVLVAAHTSAGKTVVAEYAIAMALKEGQRVIYTSPIKALSNQKYRDLHEVFHDVGLMTGDISINPTASCLVMTTEILRSMLYRGSEIMKEVAWVIFDEVHYMRDRERGVVWEETIILLPDSVRFVFLSATIPNARQFCGWIASIHNQVCHVVYTDYRPVPLQHYLFPAGSDGLHLVVDEKGQFRDDSFQRALASLGGGNVGAGHGIGAGDASYSATMAANAKKAAQKGPSDIYKIIKMIMERNYEPVIAFAFSKRECEAMALQMARLDFNNDDEKELIDAVYANAIDTLSADDKLLPQVVHLLPLLRRGIGIHHGGLLPLLKEVVEILFQEGLIKALFATETFSIGLNMPARTVLFTAIKKFDGQISRQLTSGEYIQMSGRAGRRGKDDRGIVITVVTEQLEPASCKEMMHGAADALNSQFNLGYNMLLNLLRVEEIDPEFLIRRSFRQCQALAQVPDASAELERLQAARDAIDVPQLEAVAEHFAKRSQLAKLHADVRARITEPKHVLPFLQPGRLVRRVVDGDDVYALGVIVNFHQTKAAAATAKDAKDAAGAPPLYVVDVLLRCRAPASAAARPAPHRAGVDAGDGYMQVLPVTLPLLDGLSSVRIYMPADLRDAAACETVGRTLREVERRMPHGVPLLDPFDDLGIDDADLRKLVRQVETLEDDVAQLRTKVVGDGSDAVRAFDAACARYAERVALDNKVRDLKKTVRRAGEMILGSELKAMKRVLRRLGFTNADDVVEIKGRVACEISAGDELMLTEMIFRGAFAELTPQQTVALLSCFVAETHKPDKMSPPAALAPAYRAVQDDARRIAGVMLDCKLPVSEEEYVQQFSCSLIEPVLAWADGQSFAAVCKLTDQFEGALIRVLRRLEEVLRQCAAAATSIGNDDLVTKFTQASDCIKRDIVFAASLYL
jgi:ATP-dependent RNA helicase DOB1